MHISNKRKNKRVKEQRKGKRTIENIRRARGKQVDYATYMFKRQVKSYNVVRPTEQ